MYISPPDPNPEDYTPRRNWRQYRWLIALALVGFVVIPTLIVSSMGSAKSLMVGTLTVNTEEGDSSFCGGSSGVDPGAHAQVSVVSPKGDVIGVGYLSDNPHTDAVTILGCVMGTSMYTFKVKDLPAEPRYGVKVDSLSNTIWFNPNELIHANISVGG